MSTPPPPKPGPGWYPDPSGTNTQRYFDGAKWTDQLAPFGTPVPHQSVPSPPTLALRKSPRTFVILAIGGFVTGIMSFILMQLAFGAAADGSLLFEILGFALFIVWLAAGVGLIVGIIGSIVRLLS